MIDHNGRYCSFKQYLLLKPITHGVKLWALADSITKVVLQLHVYVGKEGDGLLCIPQHPHGFASGVVTGMMESFENMCCIVTCDNYFIVVPLFENLLPLGFYVEGTSRTTRRGLTRGLQVGNYGKRGTIATLYWQDSKGVRFLTTGVDLVRVNGVITYSAEGTQGAARLKVPTSPMQLMYSTYMRREDVTESEL